VLPVLEAEPRVENKLDLLVVGLNYKPWQHLVLKFDYQFRRNRATREGPESDSDLIEVGVGFAL
jgi:hypothetical protein